MITPNLRRHMEVCSQCEILEWKSVKHEEVDLMAYETVSEARKSIGEYLELYNGQRPHSSLDRITPDKFYLAALTRPRAA